MRVYFIICATFSWFQIISSKDTNSDSVMLTAIIKNGTLKLARKLSEVDSDNFFNMKSHSGFITVKQEYNSNLFFWFFPVPDKELHTTPWIIWLQGGPGISSMLGLFDLIGPLRIESGKLKLRNVTWASDYSVLFVDNPVGAGFSYTEDDRGYPGNQDDVGEQLLEFLRQFLQMFPELRHAPLFIAGESYAGKYIPALGIQIHRQKSERINMKGILIGNGLIDPRTTMQYNKICEVLGLLEDSRVEVVKNMEENVVKLIDQQRIFDASNEFNATIEYIKKHSGVSVYNFNGDPDNEAPEFESYINKPEVRKWIHAGNVTFDYNNQVVYTKMLPDIMNTTKPWIEELLEHYGVMMYYGQLDVILGYGGARPFLRALQWSRAEEFAHAPRRKLRLTANGAVVGYKRSGGNLAEVMVRRAGHMVPKDQPEVAKFMLNSFISQYL